MRAGSQIISPASAWGANLIGHPLDRRHRPVFVTGRPLSCRRAPVSSSLAEKEAQIERNKVQLSRLLPAARAPVAALRCAARGWRLPSGGPVAAGRRKPNTSSAPSGRAKPTPVVESVTCAWPAITWPAASWPRR